MSGARPKKEQVKKGVSEDDARRRRQQTTVTLRKEKREEGLQKRRNLAAEAAGPGGAADAPAGGAAAGGAAGGAELSLANLPAYCDGVRSTDPARQLDGVVAIRRLLSKETRPPVEPILATGILPRLVALVTSPEPKIAFEAAWAVTNVASTEYTAAVVDAGAVPALVQGMMAADATVRDQCIWCVGNIGGDCVRFRDALYATPGALQALMLNLQNPETPALLANATWALSNFCRGKPSPPLAQAQPLLPALAWLVTQEATSVVSDALWGLSYLSDGPEPLIAAVVGAGVLPRVVALLGHADVTVVTPALRVVGNVICGSDTQTQAAVNAGALKALVPLLSHPKRSIKREAAWALSNVAAGTPEQIAALMTVPGLVAAVIAVLRSGEWNVKKEAAWVVSNVATSGAPEHVRQLVACGAVDALVEALASSDARMLCVVLDAVAAILAVGKRLVDAGHGAAFAFADAFEEAGLLGPLESLQEHEHEDVYSKCIAIIEAYYGVDEGGEGAGAGGAENAMAPAPTASGAFSFGFSGAPSASGGAAGGLAPTQLFASPGASHTAAGVSGGGAPCLPSGGFGAPAPTTVAATGGGGFNFGAISFA